VTATLDPADLVLIGAAAAMADPDEVLDGSDVAVLTAIARRSAGAATIAEAAAEALVGIAASRPFPSGNEAAAWLAATHLINRNGATIAIDPTDALALVAAAAAGALDERTAAASIAASLGRAPGFVRRAMRWLFVTTPSAGGVRWFTASCPRCGREVTSRVFVGPLLSIPTPRERVAICANQHRAHRRDDAIVGDQRFEALSAELDRLRARLEVAAAR